MTKNEAEYCKECRHCKAIVYINSCNTFRVECDKQYWTTDPRIYCKYKKLKKEKNNYD